MKCFGDAEESLGSSAADVSHRFLSLEVVGNFLRQKFWECEQGHLVWQINILISSQPQIPLVTKSRVA